MWEKYKHIVPYIFTGSGVIDAVADWVCNTRLGDNNPGNGDTGNNGTGKQIKKVLIVCDPNTRRIAGERVIAALEAAGINVTELCFTEDEPLPDEYSVGRILSVYTSDIDIIIGVGSGTINDLCTFTGAQVGCPSAIVGTAPSMDGYASLGSAMLFGGIKITPMTQCPAAIFCDTDILSEAPMHMIAAGLGDMLGKITSLADWQLSRILTGEEMPGDIAGIMESALDKIIAHAPQAAKRDKKAIESITEGLILSGIAMSLYGDSRPASGTEHHLAHFWEMRMLAEKRKPALHGTKVAYAAVLGLAMWQKLADDLESYNFLLPSLSAALPQKHSPFHPHYSLSYREQEIHRLYGQAAEAIIKTKNPNLPPEHIKKNRDKILKIAKSLPDPAGVAGMLSSAGITMRTKDIKLDAGTLRDSIVYARERKKTYTLLQLLGDLGLLDEYGEFAVNYFTGKALSGIKCFVLDMDGTIYLGNRLFPYTHGFLNHLSKLGMDYVFFTNNSSQNAAHYINKLHRMGITIDDSKLLMSTHVLLDYLKDIYTAPGTEVFVAGTEALLDDFEAAGYNLTDEKPEFCVLGFDTDMDYDRLTKLCDFIRAGVPLYGVNMDYNCPVDGGFIPDCGSLAAAVYTSTGVTPEFFGKPSRRALDYIISKTGYREEELCFVGDRLYTDIAVTDGTRARSVLVLSGETKRDDLAGSPHIPDVIAENLEELQGLIP